MQTVDALGHCSLSLRKPWVRRGALKISTVSRKKLTPEGGLGFGKGRERGEDLPSESSQSESEGKVSMKP